MNISTFLDYCVTNHVALSVDNEQLKVNAPQGVLQQAQISFIKENKQQLIDIIKTLELKKEKSAIFDKPLDDTGVISTGQRQMWLLEQLTSGQPYNFFRILRLNGTLNTDVLEQALHVLVMRHKQLRMTYHDNNGVLTTTCQSQPAFSLPVYSAGEGDKGQLLDTVISEFQQHEFALDKDVLLKASVVSQSEEVHYLLIKCHHIATDGWSLELINRELNSVYTALVNGKELELSTLTHEYGHFSLWQDFYLSHENAEIDREFWSTYLSGECESLNLAQFSQSNNSPLVAETVTVPVTSHLAKTLKQLCNKYNTTMYTLFQFAFTLLLTKYSQQKDVVIGTPVANRDEVELQPLVGYFVNTLPIRFECAQSETLALALPRYQDMLNQVMTHKALPLNEILKVSSLDNELLTQVMFTYSAFESSVQQLGGMDIEILDPEQKLTDLQLHLNCVESKGEISCQWHFATQLFEQSFISSMATHFIAVLEQLVAADHDDCALSQIDLLSDNETHFLVEELNQTATEFSKSACIHELIEHQAELHPEKVAVVFGDEQLTYQALNEKANELAHYLIDEHGVCAEMPVGLCVGRSLEMVVGILAILKAGGAYVPLDPSYPKERLTYMCEDTGINLILSQAHLCSVLTHFNGAILALDEIMANTKAVLGNQYSQENPNVDIAADNLAYLIYTSGSTGQPKGVMVEHHGVVAFVSSPTYAEVDLSTKMASLSSHAFDAFVYDLFFSLTNGSSLYIYPQDIALDAQQFHTQISRDGITNLFTTTALFNVLVENNAFANTKIEQVLFGGERCDVKNVERFKEAYPNVSLMHVYGPTEAVVYATACELSAVEYGAPIGRPINNNTAYILDEEQNLVPFGCIGELYVGGASLARGYFKREELTAERFIKNPFYNQSSSNSSVHLYRTGDLVRYLADGNIEFVGRADDQVKIRGFRIELGEIESRLSDLNAVDSALVMALDIAGSQQLVGYAKSAISLDNRDLVATGSEIRNQLAAMLPDYMVPSVIIVVNEWPLTVNGKIDKKALPKPDIASSYGNYVAPCTMHEKAIVDVYAEVLQQEYDVISTTSSFYELGGHSLLALNVQAQLKLQGLFVTITDILQPISIQQLAKKVTQLDSENSEFVAPKNQITAPKDVTVEKLNMVSLNNVELSSLIGKVPGGKENIADIYPLSPLQEGMLFHHIMDKTEDLYLTSFTLKLANAELVEQLITALQSLVARHDTLRTVFFWEGLPEPVQVVLNQGELCVEHVVLENYDTTAEGRALLEQHKSNRISLHQGPLLQLKVGKSNESDEYLVLVEHHHLIIDHIGLDILVEELSAVMSGNDEHLLTPTPYRNMVAYAKMKNSDDQGIGYFQELLGDLENKTTLFSGSTAAPEDTYSGRIDKALGEQLRKTSKHLGHSISAIFHTVWAQVAAQCTGEPDVVFGTVLSGRLNNFASTQRTMGMAINTLPLKVQTAKTNVRSMIGDIASGLQALIDVEQTPLSSVLNLTPFGGDLFNSVLNYRHSLEMEGEGEFIDGWEVLGAHERNNYSIFVNVDDYDLSGAFNVTVQTANGVCAKRLHGYFIEALTNILNSIEKSVELKQVSVIPKAELNTLLDSFNHTKVEYDDTCCIHELFEIQAEQNPERIAIQYQQSQLTYKQLNDKANKLARYLVENCKVVPDTLVGLSVERSPEMIIAILAILKAGGAYVPLDPSYPKDRLEFMVNDAELALILTQSRFQSVFENDACTLLTLDTLLDEKHESYSLIRHLSDHNLDKKMIELTPRHLAYVIYTSGSTGKPKGVLVEHHGVVNYLTYGQHYLQPHHKGAVMSTPLNFDATVTSLFVPLISGKQLVVLAEDLLSMFEQLAWYLFEQGDSWLFKLTPTHLDGLFPLFEGSSPCQQAHSLVIGGEQLTTNVVAKWQRHCLPNASYINEYGPTETVVGCTTFTISNEASLQTCGSSVLIGRPISNTKHFVLNGDMPAPMGAVGELCIAGVGVTRGYLNRPELNEQKFTTFTSPIGKVERIYRSGDLVRYLNDGNLEYIGRVDDQVKIRGFRIETGEVEAHLTKQNCVDSAVVLVREVDSQQVLIGYVKPSEATDSDSHSDFVTQLKALLGAYLPDYMIPSALVVVPSWPLTPNGKIDKRALPEPENNAVIGEYTAPESETEHALVAIWAELLNQEVGSISTTANFFEIGGHSLLMVRLFSHIQREFDITLELQALYESPYIRELAQLCDVIITKKELQQRLTQRVDCEIEEVEF
ncbi:non-ribosomal peptide synthetase [Pseudoalteromonas sp. S2755]|uniref:non-ribosomal peptide synthetase n=1 Tax=Pseudoalteromonas sp. S2755 TaxID=2066523 RepID=UPI00110BAAEE|nr:non-ribosomal peptide synthetase [Pseudoalteromonas sp. S2755]TMN45131.1 non-ribosomal peptide synthetase [Pseudoalteromonas sp. S2755]